MNRDLRWRPAEYDEDFDDNLDEQFVLRRPLVGYGFLVLSLVLLVSIFVLPAFRVHHIEIIGTNLPIQRISNAADAQGSNIFTISAAGVLQHVESVPEVEITGVDLALPDTVVIHAVRRQPVIAWAQRGSLFVVDAQGRVLYQVRHTRLPIIRAFVPGHVTPGQYVNPMLIVAAGYARKKLAYRHVAGYVLGERRGLIVESSDGWRAVLGVPGTQALVRRVAVLRSLLAKESAAHRLAYVDLRYSTAYAKFSAGGSR